MGDGLQQEVILAFNAILGRKKMKYFKKEASTISSLAKWTGVGTAIGAGKAALDNKGKPFSETKGKILTGAGIGAASGLTLGTIRNINRAKRLRRMENLAENFFSAVGQGFNEAVRDANLSVQKGIPGVYL